MGKPKRYNAYDGDVEANRRTIENYGRDRQVFSTGSSFRAAPFQPPISTTSSTNTSGTFGLGDPIILTEFNLGDELTGGVNVDCSLANKFRGILKGDADVTISFINTVPTDGFYQPTVLELRQDATTARNIIFADVFENDHVPLVVQLPDAYTVWEFYFSNRQSVPAGPVEPIFAFNTQQFYTFTISLSDELTSLDTASTSVPFSTVGAEDAFVVTSVKARVRTTVSGSDLICDIHKAGVSILSTRITIDQDEKSSDTSAIPPVIISASSDIAKDDLLEFFLDQRDGLNTGTGLKITMSGYFK